MEKQNIFKRTWNALIGKTRSAIIKTLHNGTTSYTGLNTDDKTFVLNCLTNSMFSVPEIKNAVNFVAEVFSTIPVYHRRTDTYGNTEYLQDDKDFVINKIPNELQTKTTFFVSIITQFLLYGKAAIIPHWFGRYEMLLDSLEPLPFDTWQEQEIDGKDYIVLTNGERKKYLLSDVILLNRFDMLNGNNDNQAISLHKSVMRAIQKRAEQNALNPKVIQAYLKMRQGNMKIDAAKARAKEIAEQISSGATESNGFVLPFVQGDVDLEKIDISAIPVDTELLDSVTEIVYNYFGLTKAIIQRKALELENEMFINTTIKPIANQVSEEFSKKLFSPGELRRGNWIEFDLTALQIATLSSKTTFFQQAIPLGIINADEAREYIGFGKIPNGLGESYMQTLNLIKKENATEYQMNMAKKGLGVSTTTQAEANVINEENNNA